MKDSYGIEKDEFSVKIREETRENEDKRRIMFEVIYGKELRDTFVEGLGLGLEAFMDGYRVKAVDKVFFGKFL